MGSERVRHDWATELNWIISGHLYTCLFSICIKMSLLKMFYLFIWLHQVLVAACRSLLYHVGHFAAVQGLSNCSSVILVCGLSCSTACQILVPGPGNESTSPALQREFLITGPPRKSPKWVLKGKNQGVNRADSLARILVKMRFLAYLNF